MILGRLLGPLIKIGLSLLGNVLKPVARSVLIPLRLTADAAIQEKELDLVCILWAWNSINNF